MDIISNLECSAPIRLPKGGQNKIETGECAAILFVLSGTASIFSKDYHLNYLEIKNGILLLPRCSQYRIEALETVTFFKCDMTLNFIQNVNQWLIQVSGNSLIEKQQNYKLPLKQKVRHLIDFYFQCDTTLDSNRAQFNEWKQNGLFLIMKDSYSVQELSTFFSEIKNQDMEFKEFVYSNFRNVRSVIEFADLAKCSLSVFCREFKKHFGESAYQWMLNRKSQYVLRDILQTSIPFQELADKYQFSSQAHFTKFCKQRYNLTPKDLRNGNKSNLYLYEHLAH